MSSTILVTGFGPFGEHKINASWESVKLLPDSLKDYKIIKEEIPVVYSHVENHIPKLWVTYKPQLVMHVGVSSFADKFTLESCANRAGYLRLDCTDKKQECSTRQGDECIKTALNVEKICEIVNNEDGLSAVPSTDAGRYLCEFIYYTSLSIDSARVLFVHVPPIGRPYSVEDLAKGLKKIILAALQQIESCGCTK